MRRWGPLVLLAGCTYHARHHDGSLDPYAGDLPEADPEVVAEPTLVVTFTGRWLPTSASLTCGEVRARVPVVDGVARFEDTTGLSDCVLRPASGVAYTPAKEVPATGALTCDVTDLLTVCR